jgi:chemotaxis protein MotA
VKQRLELGSVIGIPAAVAVVILAHWLGGGSASSLWQPTAALIVFGGTLGAVILSYPSPAVTSALRAVGQCLLRRGDSAEAIIARFVAYATLVRRHGLFALEIEIERTDDPFLRGALTLVVEGATNDVTRQALEIESHARREADEASADVLETAAGYAPTLGILGAVLGLIHVMEQLGDPSKLGSGIAVAFVSTVYGLAVANLVLLPLATRLRARARAAALCRDVVIDGSSSLQTGLNPRLVEQKLYGYLLSGGTEVAYERAA